MQPWLKQCLALRLVRRALASMDKDTLNQAAHEAATSPKNDKPEPSRAQKEAGNYAKGHIVVSGLRIAVENPAGSCRKGVDPSGKLWQTRMRHHYGYIKGTVGYDKDHIDIFVNPAKPESDTIYVVNQVHPDTGSFDEHKALSGWNSMDDAEKAYLANYQQGWHGAQSITPMSVAEFTAWAFAGKAKNGPVVNDLTLGCLP